MFLFTKKIQFIVQLYNSLLKQKIKQIYHKNMEKVIAMIAIPVSMMIPECLPGRGIWQKTALIRKNFKNFLKKVKKKLLFMKNGYIIGLYRYCPDLLRIFQISKVALNSE